MIEIISSPELKMSLERHLGVMIEDRHHVRKSWWSTGGRVAVPMESGMHFDAGQAFDIAAAFKDAGHASIYSVALEKGGGDDYLKLSAAKRDLEALNERLRMVYIALLPADGSAVILCSPDDYNIVAGPKDFVERACGAELMLAREAFLKSAFEDRLKAIAARYTP